MVQFVLCVLFKTNKWVVCGEAKLENALRVDRPLFLSTWHSRFLYGAYFLKLKKGNLILISSVQGIQAPKFEHYPDSKMSSPIEYSAIKSGIISVSRYLSKYYKNKNIREGRKD